MTPELSSILKVEVVQTPKRKKTFGQQKLSPTSNQTLVIIAALLLPPHLPLQAPSTRHTVHFCGRGQQTFENDLGQGSSCKILARLSRMTWIGFGSLRTRPRGTNLSTRSNHTCQENCHLPKRRLQSTCSTRQTT